MDSQTTWDKLKSDMKAAAAELGIDKIGIASVGPFTELKQRLLRHRELGYESGFEEPDLDKRTEPALLFDNPQSIIAIALAYPSKLQEPRKSEPEARRGILSRSAWGDDYHTVLRERLSRLEYGLKERVPSCKVLSMVDTGALSDRAVAERAGIGWSGSNCSIITPEWGSWVYLGEMITNLPLPPDKPVTESCGECTACIDACPTDALVGPGQLNAQRCISFVTQTKGVVSDELMRKIGNRLYGCDTCQVVCPENKGKNWNIIPSSSLITRKPNRFSCLSYDWQPGIQRGIWHNVLRLAGAQTYSAQCGYRVRELQGSKCDSSACRCADARSALRAASDGGMVAWAHWQR